VGAKMERRQGNHDIPAWIRNRPLDVSLDEIGKRTELRLHLQPLDPHYFWGQWNFSKNWKPSLMSLGRKGAKKRNLCSNPSRDKLAMLAK
jgi:hypothetical protein